MAGFLPLGLGLLAPLGETIGAGLQGNRTAQLQNARNQAAKGLLMGLPDDEFAAIKQAGDVSGDYQWALGQLSGQTGQLLQQQYMARTIQQLMKPKDQGGQGLSAEQAYSQATLGAGDIADWTKITGVGTGKPGLADKLGRIASRLGPGDLSKNLQDRAEELLQNADKPGAEIEADALNKAIDQYTEERSKRTKAPFQMEYGGKTYGGMGETSPVEEPSETAAPGWTGAPEAAPAAAPPPGVTTPPPAAAPAPAPAPGPAAAAPPPEEAPEIPPEVRAAARAAGVRPESLRETKASPQQEQIRISVGPMGVFTKDMQDEFLSLGGGDYAKSKEIWDRSQWERVALGGILGIFHTIPTDNPALGALYPLIDDYQQKVGTASRIAAGGRAGYGTRRAETIIDPISDFDSIMTILAADAKTFKQTLVANHMTPSPEFDQVKTLAQLRAMRPTGGAAPTGHTDTEGRPMKWGAP